jgi:hypothetical protein
VDQAEYMVAPAPEQVMNVYIAEIAPGKDGQLLGMAGGIPSGSMVVDYRTLPGVEGVFDKYDLGKTLVHEMGHALGLPHPFPASCEEGGYIQDVPPVKIQNLHVTCYENNVGCLTNKESGECCGNDCHKEMSVNHMDYAQDKFSLMYTPDQARLMRSVIKDRDIVEYVTGTAPEDSGAPVEITPDHTTLPLYISAPSLVGDKHLIWWWIGLGASLLVVMAALAVLSKRGRR